MIALSEATRSRIRRLFVESEWERVEAMLSEECGDRLPLVDTSYELLAERIRFAVLKLSAGNFAELERHVRAAQTDWRDVLLAAGFGESVRAHLEWKP